MREIMSMTGLLNKIKLARKDVDRIYKYHLDPDSNEAKSSRLFVSLYNPSRGANINGVPIDDINREIQKSYDTIINTMKNLQKYLMVKEQVNATRTIEVPSLFEDGKVMELTIAQVLVLKSGEIKNFYLNLYNRLRSDYDAAVTALQDRNEKALNNESIERYVIAKMNSLNLSNDKIISDANYEAFSKEYIKANEYKILDPLDLANIGFIEKRVQDFYESIDTSLAEFNAKTYVWIDLEEDRNFWGFVELNSICREIKNLENTQIETDL